MALIQLEKGLIVSSELILKADRMGNYTEVWLKTGVGISEITLKQIWDEHKTVWNAIERSLVRV